MIKKTNFKGLYVIKNKNLKDQRGSFMEILKNKQIKKVFPFFVCSRSKKNVIRGLHIQTKNPQGKYFTVLKGKILDVSVDLRKNSKTFGMVFQLILTDSNYKSVYIPEGFAHGFCSLTDDSLIVYSCTKYRNSKSEVAIKYDDKDLKIKWPTKKPIVSKKDQNALSYKEYIKKYVK